MERNPSIISIDNDPVSILDSLWTPYMKIVSDMNSIDKIIEYIEQRK